MWKLLDLYWNGLTRHFVVASVLLALLSPTAFSKTACTNTEIIQSELYVETTLQLKDCDQENRDLKEDLNKCKLDKEEDKVLFFFEASDVNAFMIGIVAGAVLIR